MFEKNIIYDVLLSLFVVLMTLVTADMALEAGSLRAVFVHGLDENITPTYL